MTIACRWVPFRAWRVVAVLGLSALASRPDALRADASTLPAGFVDQLMAGSLDEPVGIAEIPDPPSTQTPRVLFIEQRTARVGLVVGASIFTLGSVPGVSSDDNERGLLGVAVDPGWPGRPYIYVHCTDGRVGNRIAISRFTLTGDLANAGTGQLQFDAATRYDLLTNLPDNAVNHNGGTVRFGPDQRLYVSLGDDATGCPAQDLKRLVGKILRLDVSRLPTGPGGPPPYALLVPPDNPFVAYPDSNAMLVWTEGLRNPFRFQVDSQSGALYISDVGENAWEELDRADVGGMDMGWPMYEGANPYLACVLTPPAPLTPPIATYDHSVGLVIISAGLYHRPSSGAGSFPTDYEGDCFFLDYYVGMMRRLKGSGISWSPAPPVAGQPNDDDWGLGFDFVSDMLEMSDGSMWYCRQFVAGDPGTGEVRRIAFPGAASVPLGTPPTVGLAAPRPSPSQGSVTLEWGQAKRERVRLMVFDLGGRLVRRLEDGRVFEAGTHQSVWDGTDDSGRRRGAGIYFVRLQTEDLASQARIIVITG